MIELMEVSDSKMGDAFIFNLDFHFVPVFHSLATSNVNIEPSSNRSVTNKFIRLMAIG